jgi:hypothetical protein
MEVEVEAGTSISSKISMDAYLPAGNAEKII